MSDDHPKPPPSVDATGPFVPTREGGVDLPQEIGPYRVLALLGTGGMGAVYLAEQQAPRRQVALKVIRRERLSEGLLRRFEYESRALARLQHPGIVPIFDAGTAGDQPYYAMEHVRGRTLLEHADQQRLTVRQRVEMLIRIAEAVEYAHKKGVIHRDLKPGNILVDESGQPRVLDFGLARFSDPDAPQAHETDIGQIVGTLAYMSPEQASGLPDQVDTRTDVYALGVIAYELLSGRLPCEVKGLPLAQAVRVIAEAEPVPLGAIGRSWRGDLSTIVAKALHKDKGRRYQSAADLAADLGRYLKNEPIQARPAWALYTLGKFARRNKALVAGVAATALALLLGIAGTTYGMMAAREESVAARQAEKERTEQTARTLAESARLAARQGQRQRAIELYEEAIALGHPDEVGLRLGIIEALTDEERIREMVAAVDDLAARGNLGEHEGPMRYWKIEAQRYRRKGPQPVVEKMMREALRVGLPPAFAAVARGHLSPTVPEALKHFAEAARLRPYSGDIQISLALYQIIAGRWEDARETIGRAQLASPNLFMIDVLKAFDALANQKEDARLQALIQATEQRGARDLATVLRGLHALVRAVTTIAKRVDDTEGPSNILLLAMSMLSEWKEMQAGLTAWEKIVAPSQESPGAASALLVLPQILDTPLLGTWINHVRDLTARGLAGNHKGALVAANELVRINPQGLWFAAKGLLHAILAQDLEAEQAFREALKHPSVLDCKEACRGSIVAVRVRQVRRLKVSPPEVREALRKDIRAALGWEDRLLPSKIASLASACLMTEDFRTSLGLLELMDQKKMKAPENMTRLAGEMRTGMFAEAHRTIHRWRAEPNLPAATSQYLNLIEDFARTRSKAMLADILRLPSPADAAEIKQFAAKAQLSGDDKDANAAAWCPKSATDDAGSLNGTWSHRRPALVAKGKAKPGGATVWVIGDRVFAWLDFDQPGRLLIEARREGDRLIGRVSDTLLAGQTTPWVGRIVSPERIDGITPSGRWDLRRQLPRVTEKAPDGKR